MSTDFEAVERFLLSVGKSGTSEEIIVAIDPGVRGAIGMICGRTREAVHIPVIKIPTKKSRKIRDKERIKNPNLTAKTKTIMGVVTEFDFAGICRLFSLFRPFKERIIVALEKVPLTTFRGTTLGDVGVNRAHAMWPLFLYSRGYTVIEPRPQEWQAAFNLRPVSQKEGGKSGDNKKRSLAKAQKMFPNVDLSMVQDVDRGEALLIAEHIRLQRKGK